MKGIILVWARVAYMSHARRVELERKLAADTSMSDERKQRQLQQLGKRESAFLRLRRTKLGLDDFRTVKVIGKGAFGEVRPLPRTVVSCAFVSRDPTALCRFVLYKKSTRERYTP